jgi:hypothetical protein
MKIALYIEDGLEQIVLTPETDSEKSLLSKLHAADREMSIYHGSFYACRGGWMRQGEISVSRWVGDTQQDDNSTMIVLRPKGTKGE